MAKFFALLAVVSLFAAPVFAEVSVQVSPDGHSVEVYIDDADFTALFEGVPIGGRITGCMNSTSTYGIDWYWTMDATNTGSGFQIDGGFIDGTICDAPNWDVDDGFITATSLWLHAYYVGSGSCAPECDMTGSRSPGTPRIWSGDYGFPAHAFPHDTELIHMGPC